MEFHQMEGRKYFGHSAIGNDKQVQVEIQLARPRTFATLFASTPIKLSKNHLAYFPLILTTGEKLALLDCSVSGSGESIIPDTIEHWTNFYLTLTPRFVIDVHVDLLLNRMIRRVSVHISDAEILFCEFGRFGMARDPDPLVRSIADSVKATLGREVPLGDSPLVAYFAGRAEIFGADSRKGRMSASNSISYEMPDSRGIRIENKVFFHLDFTSPVTLEDCVHRLLPATRFFEVAVGRRQYVDRVYLSLSNQDRRPVQGYFCNWPPPPPDLGAFGPRAMEFPVSVLADSAEFASILSRWIDADDYRREARARFSGGFSKRNQYDEDRLIGAANMFDLLPPVAFPEFPPVDASILRAKRAAIKLFKSLPCSTERSRALSDLGRIGESPTLKEKILARAKVFETLLPEVRFVVTLAVDCRNHYVHGSKPKINYNQNFFPVIPFLTDALEFLFAASEFLEFGWNLAAWQSRGGQGSHPWGFFLLTYPSNLERIRALVQRKPRSQSQPHNPGGDSAVGLDGDL